MTSTRWPWLTLFACAAASGNAVAQSSTPAAEPGTAAAESEQATEREWRLPPLRLSGSLSYSVRVSGSKRAYNSSHVVTGSISGATYIYQPWLAMVDASIGLSQSWFIAKTTGPESIPGPGDTDWLLHQKVRSSEQFITGQGRLSLFNRSRFPAEITVERLDSRNDSGLLAPAISWRQQGITLMQRYRPENGAYSVHTTLTHREQEGAGASGRQYGLSGDFSTRLGKQDLGLSGSYSRARSTGDDSRFSTLLARHSYAPSSAFALHTTANATRTEEKGFGETDMQSLQLSSVGTYNPVGSPMAVSGSARAFVFHDAITDSTSHSLGATAGASYRVSENLLVNANGGASFNTAEGQNNTLYSLAGGASYRGTPLRWRDFQYDWYGSLSAGASLSQSSTEGDADRQNMSLQVGHNLNRSWTLNDTSSITMSATQGLSASAGRSSMEGLQPDRNARTLVNTVAANWQSTRDGRGMFARVSYSDSLELGSRDRFQMFNFQLSGNLDLGAGSTLTGDLTYQVTQQRSSDPALHGLPGFAAEQRTRSTGASGEITFRQARVLGVPRLQFYSRLRLAQDVLKQPGLLLSIPDRETRSWENRLDWSIGRLQAQMSLNLSQYGRQRVGSVWLSVRRSFGN